MRARTVVPVSFSLLNRKICPEYAFLDIALQQISVTTALGDFSQLKKFKSSKKFGVSVRDLAFLLSRSQ